MNVKTVNDIAAMIREVDGDNTLTARDLGYAVAGFLVLGKTYRPIADVVAFVERANPDKRLSAGSLAELLVAEFELDKE